MAATYVLDTNLLVHYIRGADLARYVDATYAPFEGDQIAFVSVVTVGEIYALAYKFGWGRRKRKTLQGLLDEIPTEPIYRQDIIDRYAEIDAYAANKLPGQPLPPGASGFVLGKNDLWIAATSSVYRATLLTTDKDFDPLDGVFLDRVYIDPDADYASY
jgi:tRNA(fMet)-specific endonuclease VapC